MRREEAGGENRDAHTSTLRRAYCCCVTPQTPHELADEIIAALAVTPTSEDRFAGTSYPAWPGRAFGGLLAAQSLDAAARTTAAGLEPWSLHIHFHAPVRANVPADYVVRRIKDGHSLASRHVAIEQDGRLRASAMALFGAARQGPRHQYERPDTPAPELLTSEPRILHTTIVPPDADADALGYPAVTPIEMRIVRDANATSRVWLRTTAPVPSDPLTVAKTLCCFADLTLGTTALEPHGGRDATTDLQLGAVELALWFTGPAQVDEWTLFSQESSFAGGGHGLAHGVFFNSAGDVCALALQDALMRNR